MTTTLDLHDIQGNIIKGYGRYGFPKARYIFYRINHERMGREFVKQLLPLLTHGAPWQEGAKPNATTNIAFTYSGLKQLGLPRQSLQSFPEEFTMGMKGRKDILGDDDSSDPDNWDPIWQEEQQVHIWLSINGTHIEAIEERYEHIYSILAETQGGVEQLHGHRGAGGRTDCAYQDASAIYIDGQPSAREHFGYVDGISEPYFQGSCANPGQVIGGGKVTRYSPNTEEGWEPLETGEFLLGHRDEADEYPASAVPRLLSQNGTFMVYRKLHENVGSFNSYLSNVGKDFPGGEEAVAAKFAGRWRNGAPITSFPTQALADQFIARLVAAKNKFYAAPEGTAKEAAEAIYLELKKQLVAFKYDNDLDGAKCPVGAHVRRANPRGALETGVKGAFQTPGALTNRRRMLRRGLPYGEVDDSTRDEGEHGIIFMAINASIKRQFEFVQQQWMNYGNDFKLSNDRDPLIGNHQRGADGRPEGRAIIEGDRQTQQPPFFCGSIPRLVETRGGDYFFLPSITALHLIAAGTIDPT